jgi:hypothetical protein
MRDCTVRDMVFREPREMVVRIYERSCNSRWMYDQMTAPKLRTIGAEASMIVV